MEHRAQVPPGLPKTSPTISYWQVSQSSIADLKTTTHLPSQADFVIVGSGISGACIAHSLLNRLPNAHVVMLEARQACSGATGRNGGHTKAASYRSFLSHERELGLAEAAKIARMEYENIIATHDLARKFSIDCASVICPTVDIIFSKTQLKLGEKAIARMRETMGESDPAADYKIYTAEEAREKFMTPDALGAFEYTAGSLSAYAFTTGILKLALAQGLNVQTTTPAESLAWSSGSEGGTWSVQTPRGRISTSNLILATNGYTAHLLPQFQGLIVPLHGQVVAQRPGLGLDQRGLTHTYSFIHETGYEYMMTLPAAAVNAGDIVVGGGLHQLPNDGATRYGETDDSDLEPSIQEYLRDCTPRFFGKIWGRDHQAGRIKKEWSGIMGASADGLPYVGAVPNVAPGLWMSCSFNGHGMVWCLKSAEALVGMMVGDKAEQKVIRHWFPQSSVVTADRMRATFTGRKDLRAPGETEFGERARL
ncbi:FAD dependent oxidoreductase [Hortaea werneckii]|nr:FAD dependent oxidoreductase [Hortaea werneckii]KAI7071376.1 FAD dependent oxidoreductase [Hortaea werneckii]KAI7245106.1 FAD dependent oxidoreductase [Hortaea werneckii]KAI7300726.1 FAD dependent oxidoreductase [Hortaea werneckii]KAI7389461.1 FAD dependent oxidoreductase [Hortaea werneckii]